uniref:F-box domain-containing protein n=1 Tax=Tetranychus urticae TaxID=32264 RepID=T1JR23_TETUR
MFINELSDDCLIAIFEYVNNLGDLINCFKVCSRWSYLIAERTKKAKYLLEEPAQKIDYVIFFEDPSAPCFYPFDCVYYQGRDLIDIFEFTKRFQNKVKSVDIVSFIRNHESLKGIIHVDADFVEYLENIKLEMLSCPLFDSSIIPNGSSMKQLCAEYDSLEDVKKIAPDFSNLEILRTVIKKNGNYDRIRVPVFEKLKILVLNSYTKEGIFYGFQFMDSCPNLQSAHITMDSIHFFVDETIKHECLQDLVIDFYQRSNDEQKNWNDEKRLLMKYPNLKHLKLAGVSNIKDANIKELVHILPNLVLLIIANSSKRVVDIVKDYCKRNGRSIKFYDGCDGLKSDWPQLSVKSEKISRGFDFMKHYFLKDFHQLPHFMTPID